MFGMFFIKSAIILLAEDNPADQELIRRGMHNTVIRKKLYIVQDGIETMEYLKRKGQYADPVASPRPDLVLLDIAMPRMDGKQVLKEMKGDPSLKTIPVVMLTTSSSEEDVIESYKLGANAYITKPSELTEFMNIIQNIKDFWLSGALLPPNPNA